MDESTRTWRDRVARWHKSGHSARVFAEQEGVNAGTLYSWSRRLGMKRSEHRQRSEKCQFAGSWGHLTAFFAGSWGHPNRRRMGPPARGRDPVFRRVMGPAFEVFRSLMGPARDAAVGI
ncbi:IS66 family insertion sequence element accessory protein TnpA [Sorangium sp. So ce204]|uniref:IS66 family insertion sequence element accessory protein TnpA n=1 Tax=Sorangium sp. So ce204 TaxID=3133288 RepID=UPI003F605820